MASLGVGDEKLIAKFELKVQRSEKSLDSPLLPLFSDSIKRCVSSLERLRSAQSGREDVISLDAVELIVELELARRFDRDKELVAFFEALFDRPLIEESLEGGLVLRSSL